MFRVSTLSAGWPFRGRAFESVEAGIRDGLLVPGEHLPPVRELAKAAGVSPGTVAAAYRLLRSRGVTLADGRRGTRIRERAAVSGRARTRPLFRPG